ncbi:hypothetical protein K438DRAFT_2079527 [Mycena galopus ATCC 62051]|nr:hypothetical protein K438DRAFT_2079527 [Mycena galopus ATCC 62051]
MPNIRRCCCHDTLPLQRHNHQDQRDDTHSHEWFPSPTSAMPISESPMPMPTPPCRPRLSPLGPPSAHATVPVAHANVFIACHCHRRLPSTPWSPTRRPPLKAMRLLLVSSAWDPAPDCARRLDTAFVPFELIRNLPSLVSLLFAYVPPSPIHPTLFPRPSLAPHFCPFFPRFHDTNQHPTQAEAETAAAAAAKADEHAELAKAAYDTEIARMRRTLLHRETMRLRRREWDRQSIFHGRNCNSTNYMPMSSGMQPGTKSAV